MNTVGKGLLAGSAVLLIGGAGAGIATGLVEPEVQVKEFVSPGPTITEIRNVKVPVPGPTVTKKVTITKTVRPAVPKEVSRSNERKKSAVSSGSARDIARQIFGSGFSCADSLITKESGWRLNATNPSSGAYGLPQSLPGSKMASAGSDWRTNPATQLRWMKSYVDSHYGGICNAWTHSQAHNWY
ncbi:hypothetical protein AB0D68_11085 [Streptomyces sp. NPDC048212]|uniref:aggregation-promoting factor C-terminal-like domain-containing protein n=1 Tax=Streptomyces sp. NPDC048212 TaxID=3156658 RepID=UPI0033DAE764